MLKRSQKIKWKYILTALGINLSAILIFFWAAYVFWDINPLSIENIAAFRTRNAPYFYTLNQLPTFIVYALFREVLFEEAWARGPAWLLINSKIKHRTKLSYAAIVILGAIWAKTHVLFWPVFAVGIIWGTVLIKTKSLWSAFVCHASANLFLYICIKFLQYFQYTS